MKLFPLTLAALVLSAPVLHAKVLYNITLTNADTYTQCDIKYRGSRTKFVGKDKSGKMQTIEVPSSRILNVREVAPEPTPAPAPEPEKKETTKPAADETPANTDAETPVSAEEGASEAKPADTPAAEAQPAEPEQEAPAAKDDGQVQNASLRLREKLAEIDKEYSTLRAPSPSLTRRLNYTRERINRSLDTLDKQALKVAELQEEFNKAGRGEFTFEFGTEEQRSQYVRDGEAAYKAMVIDMKEKPGARKVGGIDKFEIMRDRYQGIPEYKEAYDWYIRTLKSLDKKWRKMLDKEKKRRKGLPDAKKTAMANADTAELESLRKAFAADGEDIAAVWFNPRSRNLEMLELACHKVNDALRRNQNVQLDAAVGTIPSLLTQFWTAMDEARQQMMQGQLDQAEDTLKKNASRDVLRGMRSNIFPEEYRAPIMEQHKKLEDEIRARKRNVRNNMSKLEREASMLERSTGSAEAQINALLEEIQREKNLDAGENTVAMEESMNEAEEGDDTKAEETKTEGSSPEPAGDSAQ